MNKCLSDNLKRKLRTFFFEATGEWCSPAVTRWESVSWPREQSLTEETEYEQFAQSMSTIQELLVKILREKTIVKLIDIVEFLRLYRRSWRSRLVLVLTVILAGCPGPSLVRALTEKAYSWFCCRPSMVTDFLRGSATDMLNKSRCTRL